MVVRPLRAKLGREPLPQMDLHGKSNHESRSASALQAQATTCKKGLLLRTHRPPFGGLLLSTAHLLHSPLVLCCSGPSPYLKICQCLSCAKDTKSWAEARAEIGKGGSERKSESARGHVLLLQVRTRSFVGQQVDVLDVVVVQTQPQRRIPARMPVWKPAEGDACSAPSCTDMPGNASRNASCSSETRR